MSFELAKTQLRVGFESATYCNQEIFGHENIHLALQA